MLLLFLIFWIRSVKCFCQKEVFGSNGFSAETAFHPKILEVAFWPEMAFCPEMTFRQEMTFQPEIVRNGFFQMNLPYFSKY